MARLTIVDPAQATGDTKELLDAVKAKIGSTRMAEIGPPNREIDVRPVEPPVPRELPLEPAPVPQEPVPEQEPVRA